MNSFFLYQACAYMLTLARRFHALNANSICGRRTLYITATALVVTNDKFAPAVSYKLHELETALEHSAYNCACLWTSTRVVVMLMPSICATLMHRIGVFVQHLCALRLQDLLPAITHYYLWDLPAAVNFD